MMQPFEFSNNALSLMLAVFSVIVGMAYPLLLQAIQKIDEQYGSPRITKMLASEPLFKRFQWLIVISIAFAFGSIFVLQIIDGCYWLVIGWVLIHALVSLSLLISTISLVRLILILNSATLWFNFIYKFLSNKKLLRILPCQIFHLS